jgi:hypothetical protein
MKHVHITQEDVWLSCGVQQIWIVFRSRLIYISLTKDLLLDKTQRKLEFDEDLSFLGHNSLSVGKEVGSLMWVFLDCLDSEEVGGSNLLRKVGSHLSIDTYRLPENLEFRKILLCI